MVVSRFVVFFLTLAGIVYGFTYAGGKLAFVIHFAILLPVASIVVGALILGFGYARSLRLFFDAIRGPSTRFPDDLRTNVLMCECASRAALCGAFIAFLFALVGAVATISGDISLIGERIAAATSAPVAGVMISALVFRPLKLRYLSLQKEPLSTRDPLTAKAAFKGFALGAVGFVISVILIAAYINKIVPYLEKILGR